MATTARPVWTDMCTEVALRLGNHTYTTFTERVERFLQAAYHYVVTTWHHPELDGEDEEQTLKSGASSVLLPEDIKIPTSVALLDPAGSGDVDRYLKLRDFHTIRAQFDDAQGKPSLYARYGKSLYFDRKSNAAYPIRIFYYAQAPLPLFDASVTSPLAPEFDEIIMKAATWIGHDNLWRPDLASLDLQSLGLLTSSLPNRQLREDQTADRSSRPKRDTSHVGALG